MLINCFGKHHKIVMSWLGTEDLFASWRPQQVSNTRHCHFTSSQKNIFCSLLFLEGRSAKWGSRCGAGEEAQAPHPSPLWNIHCISYPAEYIRSHCERFIALFEMAPAFIRCTLNVPAKQSWLDYPWWQFSSLEQRQGFLYVQSHYCLAACWMAAKLRRDDASTLLPPVKSTYLINPTSPTVKLSAPLCTTKTLFLCVSNSKKNSCNGMWIMEEHHLMGERFLFMLLLVFTSKDFLWIG